MSSKVPPGAAADLGAKPSCCCCCPLEKSTGSVCSTFDFLDEDDEGIDVGGVAVEAADDDVSDVDVLGDVLP